MKNVITAIACAIFAAGISAAMNCGDQVSGNVTLTADLICTSSNGLIVAADNTTINLNGHTIQCVGAGYMGSCQIPAGAIPGPWYLGVQSNGYNNVAVVGPGKIDGFAMGVALGPGNNLAVKNLAVTGPIVEPVLTQRAAATGVSLSTTCGPSTTSPVSAVISGNEISGQAVGIRLMNSGCIDIHSNIVHDINSVNGEAAGIHLFSTTGTRVYRNTVTKVGMNKNHDAGIHVEGLTTMHNQVFGNYVSNNCGNGISLTDQTSQNNIYSNTARFNGLPSTTGNSCFVPITEFDDLYESFSGVNTWNANNTCRTESFKIPVGVCGPNE